MKCKVWVGTHILLEFGEPPISVQLTKTEAAQIVNELGRAMSHARAEAADKALTAMAIRGALE